MIALAGCPCLAAWGQFFEAHGDYLSVGPHPSAVVAADLNGDGFAEIITADRGRLRSPRDEVPANTEISMLTTTGELAYQRTTYPVGFAPYALAVANVDARKALDVVVASFMDTRQREGQRDLTLMRNLGDGIFSRDVFAVADDRILYKRALDADDHPAFATPGITSLLVEDMNGDGLRDAIATGWASDVLIFFPGDADTYFRSPRLVDAPGGPRDVATADFDGDGLPDLAVTLYMDDAIGLWRGEEDGQFEAVTRFDSGGRLPHRIRTGDIDGDGKVDMAVSHCDRDDSIRLFYGDGAFSFGLSQEILLGPDRDVIEHEIRDLLLEDLDADGRLDLAVACYASAKVIVFWNRTDGKASRQIFKREEYTFDRGRPRALCVADVNSDGKRDLVIALWEADAVTLLLGR
jgi:hypothetical protein